MHLFLYSFLVNIIQARLYEGPGTCSAFLSNNHTTNANIIKFRGTDYFLPPKSISILPDCKTVVFNTQQVSISKASFPPKQKKKEEKEEEKRPMSQVIVYECKHVRYNGANREIDLIFSKPDCSSTQFKEHGKIPGSKQEVGLGDGERKGSNP